MRNNNSPGIFRHPDAISSDLPAPRGLSARRTGEMFGALRHVIAGMSVKGGLRYM